MAYKVYDESWLLSTCCHSRELRPGGTLYELAMKKQYCSFSGPKTERVMAGEAFRIHAERFTIHRVMPCDFCRSA